MPKKLILILATVCIGVGSYGLFSLGDRRVKRAPLPEMKEEIRQFVTPATTQASQSISDSEMTFSPGDQTRVRIYDEITGRLRYQFEAETWEPTSNTDFALAKPLIQIFTPKGEITYIRSDKAQVTLTRKGRNRLEPKNGWLRGKVEVTIDRTTTAWREAHPQLADVDLHPDDLIHIYLEEARFDLEQAELVADGPFKMDSLEARVENVNGLLVQWDQADNRIDVLRFKHGGTMILRRGGKVIDFAMPGTERSAKAEKKDSAKQAAPQTALLAVPKAQAMKPMSINAPRADEAAAEIRLEGNAVVANKPRTINAQPATPAVASNSGARSGATVEAEVARIKSEARAGTKGEPLQLFADVTEDAKGRKRVQTYRAVFENKVLVEQRDGLRTIGKLEADKLEINFDFGKQQKEMAGAGGPKPSKDATSRPTSAPAEPPTILTTPIEADKTRLVLTWDGPLELRPIVVAAKEQTGQRFDCVATGAPVRIQSQDAKGTCKQLVYRHERRQAWLSGSLGEPVQLAIADSQQLIGPEVFFDQKRGVAHVEGGGTMTDDRQGEGSSFLTGMDRPAAKRNDGPARDRPPVAIKWTRGVDIDIGSQPIERINPATGAKETKQKEFLRRAWFHGNVQMTQGAETLKGEEVAATFGTRSAGEEVKYNIEHLNMSGNVRLARDQEELVAERLDAEMTVTAEGRNIPRIVDAEGDVLARTGERQIRANRMHVVMGLVSGKAETVLEGDRIVTRSKSRLGMETLDADGDVFVSDPENNMKIRDAKILRAVMRDGQHLVHAAIRGGERGSFAKVRAGDVAIHGHQIDIDADRESIDVPGPGRAWMVTNQDFGGRPVAKRSSRATPVQASARAATITTPLLPIWPVGIPAEVGAIVGREMVTRGTAWLQSSGELEGPVTKITWRDQMQFRMAKDYGVFLGAVKTDSDSFSVACDKLTVRFGRAPARTSSPPGEKQKTASAGWQWGRMLGQRKASEWTITNQTQGPRRRPVFIVADGNAVGTGHEYAPDPNGDARGRLVSRMTIFGDQIASDLIRQRMTVPCPGNMLIEDYQFDSHGGRKSKTSNVGPLMSAARGEGPSQTKIEWKNSMDFYVDQNLVAFDKDVEMVHYSGQQIVQQEALAAAMRVDPASLKKLKTGRRATLNCGYLLLEFQARQNPKTISAPEAALARATDLERVIAKHNVHLQDGSKSIMGEYLQFLRTTDEIQIEGTPAMEARIFDQDEQAQRVNMWRGPLLIWNRKTNRIEAPEATIRTSRR